MNSEYDGTEPLPPVTAHQVEESAIEQAAVSSGSSADQFRRGRIEAETHFISEEVTRQAQERERLAHSGRPDEPPAATRQSEELRSFTGRESLPPAKPIRRVLVALDGSLGSEPTLPYAALLANQLRADLTLGHVETARLAERNTKPDRSHVSSYVARLRDLIPASVGSRIEVCDIDASTVPDGLIELEASTKTDLALVALHKNTLTKHLSLGRVADSLIQKGTTPVMVIAPRAVEDDGHPVSIRHILVPLDGSALAEQALAPLLGWLGRVQLEQNARLSVTLFGVAENQVAQSHYQSYLDSLRTALLACPECARFPQLRLQAEAVVGSVPNAIVDAVEQNVFGETFRSEPTDLVVMATHGRGGLGRWLFGSVASYVLPRVNVPVLVVHPAFLDM